jgi:F-type H+-transporting ATPase subunit delta
MMRSASREASRALAQRQDAVLGRVSSNTLVEVADDLYGVAALLVQQPRLRRILGDPATAPEGRSELATRLLDDQVGERAMQIVQAAVEQRWSSPWDLCDALENAADDALFAAAEADGVLEDVEDQLFRLERILDNQSDLTTVLDEMSAPAERRAALLDRLIGGKVAAIALALARHAVVSERKRSISLALDDLLERAADRKARSVARVVSATPLTNEQEARLAAALAGIYGRQITILAAVHPSVRGGLVIRIGDEVIDGSIAARLADARTALAG